MYTRRQIAYKTAAPTTVQLSPGSGRFANFGQCGRGTLPIRRDPLRRANDSCVLRRDTATFNGEPSVIETLSGMAGT